MKEHNKYRQIHLAPELFLSSALSKESQRYANELASRGTVVHSLMKSRPHTGESIEKLCSKSGGMPTPLDILKKWLVDSSFE